MASGGNAPVLVFVDAGGAFTKDTECVNGVRGNAADHLTKDVVSFMVSTFGVSTHSANWGIAGWSMGGTCAVTLTVMHPELFSAFVDIGGDIGPNAGTKEQTVERMYNGDEAAWASFDPSTVMTRHGRYTAVSGVFAIEGPVDPGGPDEHAAAAHSLAATASANGIACSILEIHGKHDWNAGAVGFEQTFAWVAGRLPPRASNRRRFPERRFNRSVSSRGGRSRHDARRARPSCAFQLCPGTRRSRSRCAWCRKVTRRVGACSARRLGPDSIRSWCRASCSPIGNR